MAGLPGVDDLDALGGQKIDYEPVEDPSTDLSADNWNLAASNVAGMTQTIDRAWASFIGKASTPPDEPASNVHGAVWGSGASVKPVFARTGAGVYTITWPSTIEDALGVEHTVSLRNAVSGYAGTTAYIHSATITAANVVTLRVWDAAGVANDAVGSTFTVRVT